MKPRVIAGTLLGACLLVVMAHAEAVTGAATDRFEPCRRTVKQ
jgi:hypothetical protein